MTLSFGLAPDQLLPFIFNLFEADYVQQFVVEFLVEGVAVIGERLLEQMGRREDLVEGCQLTYLPTWPDCGLPVHIL